MKLPELISKLPKSKGLYKCDCGKEFTSTIYDVKIGHTKSCGCYNKKLVTEKNYVHGHSYNPLYSVWANIKTRCYNKNNPVYKNYGGRGITMCDEWKNDFMVFKLWAEENGYSKTLSIDRINNDGDYEPSNCRWVNAKVQAVNRRYSAKNTQTQGITYKRGRWIAQISINNRPKMLGIFDTSEEASIAYQKAKKEREEMYLRELEANKNKK